MTIPRRKVQQRARLHMGELRWLLGARPRWDNAKGDSSHGSITRWRYLFVHIYSYDDWQAFQERHWDEMRNRVLRWHRVRGWRVPPPSLRGHRAERAWLWNERRNNPRGRYEPKPGARWGLEARLTRGS